MPHGHVQSSRDWRSCQIQHVHFRAKGFQLLFLLNTESVLLINDDQAKVFELDVALKQLVGADHNIGFAFFDGCHRFGGLAAAAEAAE